MENGGAVGGYARKKTRRAASTKRSGREGAIKKENGRRRGIDTVIEILEFLHTHDEPIRPNQIAIAVKAARSTVYSVVKRLMEAGLVEAFDKDGRIFLGRRLLSYGASYIRHYDLMREADQVLRLLTKETNVTSQLSVMDSGKYMVAQIQHGGHHFRISTDLGRPMPLPWTASGPLLVSDLSDEEILQLIPHSDFRFPDGSDMDPTVFLKNVRLSRKRGLSRQDGVVDAFIHCLAAPVLNAEGRCVATLCLVIPRMEVAKHCERLIPTLVAAAADLTQRNVGYAPLPSREAFGAQSRRLASTGRRPAPRS
jgi:DNA-binding IclR family transcriptional regulator